RATRCPTRSPGAASAPRPRQTSTPAFAAWTVRSWCLCSPRLPRRMVSRPAASRSPTRPCWPRCARIRAASTPTCTPPSSPAARGAEVHLLNPPVAASGAAALQESVALGSQIYACTAQPDGSFAFTQHDVNAHLTDDIHHTFVRPLAGTPQWQAPDGSAVTGKVVTRNANGAGNIAELNLDATQIGASTGLLAHAVEVLRLNTAGGVAPARPFDPQATPIPSVPYQADYVFING